MMLAAFMNLLGALTGTAVALTIANGLLNTDVVDVTPQVILCALLGGIIWNLITWWKGLPSSSSLLRSRLKRRSKPMVVPGFSLIPAPPQSDPPMCPGQTSAKSPSSSRRPSDA